MSELDDLPNAVHHLPPCAPEPTPSLSRCGQSMITRKIPSLSAERYSMLPLKLCDISARAQELQPHASSSDIRNCSRRAAQNHLRSLELHTFQSPGMLPGGEKHLSAVLKQWAYCSQDEHTLGTSLCVLVEQWHPHLQCMHYTLGNDLINVLVLPSL